MLYVVWELKTTFISREALESMGYIVRCFPQVPSTAGYNQVAAISDVEEFDLIQNCVPPSSRGRANSTMWLSSNSNIQQQKIST